MRTAIVLALLLSAALASGGCSRDGGPAAAPEQRAAPAAPTDRHGLTAAQAEQVVVRVGDSRILLGELAVLLGPRARRRRQPPEAERRAAFLEKLVETELLFAEARRQGLDRDPTVERARRQAMVERLLDDVAVEQRATEQQIGDPELESYYRSKIASFTSPEQVQAAHILLASEAEARALRDDVLQAREPAIRFSQLAVKRSLDSRTAAKGGNLGWLAREASPMRTPSTEVEDASDAVSRASSRPPSVPDALRAAVFEMHEAGELAVVRSDRGHHVVRYLGRRAPTTTPLPQVARVVRRELAAQRREVAVQALLSEVGERRHLVKHAEQLAQVRW